MSLLFILIYILIGFLISFLMLRVFIGELRRKVKALESKLKDNEEYSRKLKEQKLYLIERLINLIRDKNKF